MALRNVFGELALDTSIKELIQVIKDKMPYPYARDGLDQLRAVITNQVGVTVYNANSASTMANNISPQAFNSNTWNAMDAREEFRDITMQTFQQTRNRWNIT